jgi:hypothetical protein
MYPFAGYRAHMNDDAAATDADEEPTDGGLADEYDDAVIAADDTGMLSGERLITVTEIEQGLEGK